MINHAPHAVANQNKTKKIIQFIDTITMEYNFVLEHSYGIDNQIESCYFFPSFKQLVRSEKVIFNAILTDSSNYYMRHNHVTFNFKTH